MGKVNIYLLHQKVVRTKINPAWTKVPIGLDSSTQIGEVQFSLEKAWTDSADIGAYQEDGDDFFCYKISSLWMKKPELTRDTNFVMQISSLQINVQSEHAIGEGMAVLSSDANSYGLRWMRWFDGKANSLKLNGPCNHHFAITEVHEYKVILIHGENCSPDDWYRNTMKLGVVTKT